jgi:hypothetical protein
MTTDKLCEETEAGVVAEQSPIEKLRTYFADQLPNHLNAIGVHPHIALVFNDEQLTVLAVDLPPTRLRRAVEDAMYDNATAAVFGMDISCRPNQGTTLADMIALFEWLPGTGWYFGGVIEYQHEPRIVRPLAFNAYWDEAFSGYVSRINS